LAEVVLAVRLGQTQGVTDQILFLALLPLLAVAAVLLVLHQQLMAETAALVEGREVKAVLVLVEQGTLH
jgi:hypothetical protein